MKIHTPRNPVEEAEALALIAESEELLAAVLAQYGMTLDDVALWSKDSEVEYTAFLRSGEVMIIKIMSPLTDEDFPPGADLHEPPGTLQ